MVFLPFLHIHTRKSIFSHKKARNPSVFGDKNGQKRPFAAISGWRFRMVAQNFRPNRKSPFLLPFMSKNGNFYAKNASFCRRKAVFLCKIHKNRGFFCQIVHTAPTPFLPFSSPRPMAQKAAFFVQPVQNKPPAIWLTAPTCVSIMGEVSQLTPISHPRRHAHPRPLRPPRHRV